MTSPQRKRTNKKPPKTVNNADRLFSVMVRLGLCTNDANRKYRAFTISEDAMRGVEISVDEFNAIQLSQARRNARYAARAAKGT
mgnify:CR=1 FL=1